MRRRQFFVGRITWRDLFHLRATQHGGLAAGNPVCVEADLLSYTVPTGR